MNDIQLLQQIIDRTKQLPNSPYRNKAASHLFDGMAYLKLMQLDRFPQSNPNVNKTVYGIDHAVQGADRTVIGSIECTCPDGQINPACPIHGA